MTQIPNQLPNYEQILALPSFQTLRKYGEEQIEDKNVLKTEVSSQQAKCIESRSKKKVNQTHFQISFEDGILYYHIKAFYCAFNVFYGEINNNIQNLGTFYSKEEQQIVQNKQSQFDYQQWIQNEINKIEILVKDQKIQLIEDWKRQQNLIKFLKTVCGMIEPCFKSQVICLASIIWQSYLNYSSPRYNAEESVKKITDSLITNIQKLCSIPMLKNTTKGTNPEDPSTQLPLVAFLSNYCLTLYLVIQQYFDNPFQEQAETRTIIKQIRFDDDQVGVEEYQFVGLPRKMPRIM